MIPMSFSTHNFSKGYQSQKNIGVLREVKVGREEHGIWCGFTEQLGVFIPEAPLLFGTHSSFLNQWMTKIHGSEWESSISSEHQQPTRSETQSVSLIQ